MDRVVISGLEIAYRCAGRGPPLLWLHGGFGDSRDWRRQLDGLSDEFTVVAWVGVSALSGPTVAEVSGPTPGFDRPDR